jgi:hypothetical protein
MSPKPIEMNAQWHVHTNNMVPHCVSKLLHFSAHGPAFWSVKCDVWLVTSLDMWRGFACHTRTRAFLFYCRYIICGHLWLKHFVQKVEANRSIPECQLPQVEQNLQDFAIKFEKRHPYGLQIQSSNWGMWKICTFFPDNCAEPFHSCIWTSTSWTVSPTERACGHRSASKKKEPRMVESEMAHKNSAEICSSPPESEVDDSRCC